MSKVYSLSKMRLKIVLLFLATLVPAYFCKELLSSCEYAKITKVGCYNDHKQTPRPLPELVLSDRDPSSGVFDGHIFDWKKPVESMQNLACRCARKILHKNYTHFSLQFFGECWSGGDSASTYAVDGPSKGCLGKGYKECDNGSDTPCTGVSFSSFVYKAEAIYPPTVPPTEGSNCEDTDSTKRNVTRDRLSVTFGKFSSLPLTVSQAEKEGWKKDASCLAGSSQNFFRGNRFVRFDDKTTRILYDCHGRVAGIQTTIEPTKDFPTPYNSAPWHKNKDGTITATAYFRNPKRICSCRCQSKEVPPVGDRLWIQLGDIREGSQKFMEIPLNKKEIANTPWVEGNCVSAMGVHYHYNISKDFDCNYALPVFLIVNKYNGDVHGFGWGVPMVVNSIRWEHPPPELFARSIKQKNIPACVLKYKAFSVQHIYFVDPLKITCF